MMSCEQLQRNGRDVTANDTVPPPTPIRANAIAIAPRRREHRIVEYTKQALLHPSNMVLPVLATMIGVIHLSLILPLVMLLSAELIFLLTVPRIRPFQECIDAKLDRADRIAAAEARAALLLKVSAEHRKELERLERLIDRVRDSVEDHAGGAQFAVDDCLNLVASFVRLAIAHNSAKECLATTDRLALEHEVRGIETALPTLSTQAVDLARRRLSIAKKRAQRWDASREELEIMGQQLAMIGALVHLRHEQCGAPRDPSETTIEIDRAMRELEESEGTLREIREFCAKDNVVEPRMLDMGRNLVRPVST